MPDILIATPSQLLAVLRRGAGAGAGGKAKGGGAAAAAAGVQLRDSLHTLIIDEADLLLSYGYGEQTSEAQYSCRKLVSSHTTPLLTPTTDLEYYPCALPGHDIASMLTSHYSYLPLTSHYLLLTTYRSPLTTQLPGDDIASIGEALPPSVQTMLV